MLLQRWPRAFENKTAEIPRIMKLTTMVERIAFFILTFSFISARRLSYWPLTHSTYLLAATKVFVFS
jgi:hypothetical protein